MSRIRAIEWNTKADGKIPFEIGGVVTNQVSAVLVGDAVGVGLASQIRRDVRAGRITILPLKLAWLTTDYGIIRLAGRTPSPLLVEFINLLRKVESELRDD